MPINLQGSGPIVEGWGPPPQLHAPEIGSLVHAILSNRLGQQELSQKSIADAVKEVQSQRQSAAYTDALQKAGLLPEGDYGGLGIKGGESIADMIQRQKAQQALEAHRAGVLDLARSRGGGGGGGGGDGGGDGGDTGGPEIVEKDGIKYLVNRTSKSVTYHRLPGQWGPTRAEQENAAPSMEPQTVYPDEPAPTDSGTPPPASTPIPSGKGADQNLASGFGKPVSDEDVAALGWARAHPGDPRSAAILDKLGVPH